MREILKNNSVLRNLSIIILFFCSVLILYYPTLKSAPLWDDWIFIFNSHTLKEIGIPEFWKWGDYRRSWPVYFSTISIMMKSWGGNVFNYHLTSVFTHALNGWLIYRIIKKIKGNYAILISLLYLVHPLNFYTVAWIIQFKTLMCIFFFLISLEIFLDNEENFSKTKYILSIIFFALSLLSKSAFAPLILMMPFYKNRKRILPYILICLYSIGLTLWSSHIKTYVSEFKIPDFLISKVLAQENVKPFIPQLRPLRFESTYKNEDPYISAPLTFNNFAKYSAFVIYPWDSLLVHPSTVVYYSYFEIISALIIMNLMAYSMMLFWEKKNLMSMAGLAFFIVSILPLCGAIYIPIFHYSNFVEYWLSVPVLGLLLCLASLKKKKMVSGLLIFFIAGFIVRTYIIARLTPEPISMYTTSALKSPKNDLIKMALAKHYFFTREYANSNKVLLNLKRSSNLDKDKIDIEININTRALRGGKVNETTL